MNSVPAHNGVRAFLMVWAGQLVSLVGSGMTALAIGIQIFQQTGSAARFTLVTFCAAAPPLLALPLAGPLIDRWDRRRLLILCDLIAASATCLVAWTAGGGQLSLPLACLVVAVMSIATGLQWPTHAALVTTLVPREHLGRAGGLTQVANGTANVLAPLLAGALLPIVGLSGIALIDLATFGVSILLLAAAPIPKKIVEPGAPRRSYRADIPFGLRYIFGRRDLAVLLLMFTAVSFFTEMAAVLFTPLILTLSTPATLGRILALGSLGLIGGGILMGVWGGPRRPASGAAAFAALGGAGGVLVGLSESVAWLAAAAALYFFCEPLMSGCSQIAWQRTVPADVQGRVFATRSVLAASAMPLASLAAGPLADRSGIPVIFVAMGSLSILTALLALASEPLRRLDEAAGPRPAPEPAGAII
jgi:DHA3 family macrolide efflux protein-like MFS transporter